MIVGGLLILIGLYFASEKADNYAAWCDKRTSALEKKMTALAKQKRKSPKRKRSTVQHKDSNEQAHAPELETAPVLV